MSEPQGAWPPARKKPRKLVAEKAERLRTRAVEKGNDRLYASIMKRLDDLAADLAEQAEALDRIEERLEEQQ